MARYLSERGFAQHDRIPGAYGGFVRVYESSAASAPHVWVHVVDKACGAVLHLTVENARQLAADLTDLCDNHYQGTGQETRQ